jgi:hypothetical protein
MIAWRFAYYVILFQSACADIETMARVAAAKAVLANMKYSFD